MSRKLGFLFFVLFFSLTLLSNVFSAPWVNLRLTYDYAVHNYNAESVYIKINGLELNGLEMPPIIMNNMTLVPAREVLEPLGAVVDWKKDSEELFVAYEDKIAIIKIGSKYANCNGITSEMALAPKIINNKTMVPVRFISDVLGFEVNWVDEERTIYINSPESTTAYISESTAESETENGVNEIYNPFFDSASETQTEESTEASTEYNSLGTGLNITGLNNSSLAEINFNDDFYYDRNMKNLVISSAYILNGISGVVQQADKINGKYYFGFKLASAAELSSGYYEIDDDSISRIDIFNNSGEIIICFNEKSEVGYKVYEEQGYVYFKPFI